jgi:serine/threonine protein kinase
VTDPKKELLADLLLQWEELRERGQDTPATEIAKHHPELIEELAHRIKALKTISWLDKPLDDDPPGECPSGSPSPSPRTLAGRYRLDELIAEGGFAQVYRAYDTELQRPVAIKIPKPSTLDSKEAFQAEARRVARLKHDNIVPVHDVGVENDISYIVTEYVDGGSLADRLAKGKPSREEAIRWICDIADALEYAHLNGVIHLDIKPANILIDANGRALLADFGIARSAMKTGDFAPSLGTLRYMSPEQLEGKPADHRSDIYSLGVVLHEVLTGHIPYSSQEPNVLRKEIVQGRADAGNKKLSPALQAICKKALSKSPYQRQASAAQFAAELNRAADCTSWKWRSAAIAAGVIGLCVAGATLLFNKQPQRGTAAVFSSATAPRDTTPAPTPSSPRKRQYIPMLQKDRIVVPPETVGVEKDCPFPTVKERISFQCPECNLRMFTHVLYPHLPHCPKDGAVMFEEWNPSERQHWLGDKNISFIYDGTLKRWKEQTGDEPPSCFFDETMTNNDYVELFDPLRKVSIRLHNDHAQYREDDGEWVVLRAGKWIATNQ